MTVCFEQNNKGSRTQGREMGGGGTWEIHFSW